jgi:hypothetical protein
MDGSRLPLAVTKYQQAGKMNPCRPLKRLLARGLTAWGDHDDDGDAKNCWKFTLLGLPKCCAYGTESTPKPLGPSCTNVHYPHCSNTLHNLNYVGPYPIQPCYCVQWGTGELFGLVQWTKLWSFWQYGVYIALYGRGECPQNGLLLVQKLVLVTGEHGFFPWLRNYPTSL